MELENLDPNYESAAERLNRFFDQEKGSLHELTREELLWYLATVLLWLDLRAEDDDADNKTDR